MKRRCRVQRLFVPAATAVAVAACPSALACATCYGQSDSLMAQGMNWGIMVLLGFIGVVLSGVTAFFVVVARKSAALPEDRDFESPPESRAEVP